MNKKVLVVDDEMAVRKITVDELKKQGFETLEAADGKDGLDSALKNKPDLILLDINMPEMDGLTMLKKLREEETDKIAQVIVLTNAGDFSKIADAVEKGICSYLVKSDITTEDLVKRVKQLL